MFETMNKLIDKIIDRLNMSESDRGIVYFWMTFFSGLIMSCIIILIVR